MTRYAPTPNLSLERPQVGTGEQWSTQDFIVGNFLKVDDFAGTTDARLDTLELNNAGTTAQRDAKFGVPANAAARVALANKGARWLNLEKGWEEQYFAQFDDAGVSVSTPQRPTFGWKPARDAYLQVFSASGTGVTKKGSVVDFVNCQTLALDNVFSTDFDDYLVEIDVISGATDASIYMRFRAGGVTNVGANYVFTYNETTGGGANAPAANGAGVTTGIPIGRSSSGNGSVVEARIIQAKSTARRTLVQSRSVDSTNYRSDRGGGFSLLTPKDGFEINTQGVNITGELRVRGIAGKR